MAFESRGAAFSRQGSIGSLTAAITLEVASAISSGAYCL